MEKTVEKRASTKKELVGLLHMNPLDMSLLQGQPIYCLVLPKDFRDYLLQTDNHLKEVNNEDKAWHLLHIKTLAKKLFQEHGHLFHVSTEWGKAVASETMLSPFLYATKEIDPRYLLQSIKEWFECDSGIKFDYKPNQTWIWEQKVMMDFAKGQVKPIFGFLPSYFHHGMSLETHAIEGINSNNPISFTHVLKEDGTTSCVSNIIWIPTSLSRYETEKMTWYLESYPERVRKNGSSVKVLLPAAIELQYNLMTKPLQPNNYYLKLNISLNRRPYWDFSNDITYGDTFKLLIHSKERYYMDEKKASTEITVKNNGGTYQVKEEKEHVLLSGLEELGFDIHKLVTEPMTYLNKAHELPYEVYPIFNNSMSGKKMYVEQGIGLSERNRLFHYISEFNNLALYPALTGANIRSNREGLPFVPGSKKEAFTIEVWDDVEKRVFDGFREHLGSWLGGADTEFVEFRNEEEIDMTIPAKKRNKKGEETKRSYPYRCMVCSNKEVAEQTVKEIEGWWEVEKVNKKSIAHKAYLLFVPGKDEDHFTWMLKTKEQELWFQFVWRDIRNLNNPLDTFVQMKNGHKKTVADENKRIEEIKKWLSANHPLNSTTMAIINVPPYHIDVKTKKWDSKGALKRGFAISKRLPQFINGGKEKEDIHPYISAFEDILKCYGLLPKKLFEDILTEDEIWYGFKGISYEKSMFLLACKMEHGQKTQLRIVDEDTWMSIEEFNRKAAAGELFTGLNKNRKKFQKEDEKLNSFLKRYYKDKLLKLIEIERNATWKHLQMVFDAALRRNLLGDITNDMLYLDSKPYIEDDRINYIRFNSTDLDVPEMDAIEKVGDAWTLGKSSGIFFEDDLEVAYSIASKSDNMRAKTTDNKLEIGEKAMTRQTPKEIFICGVEDKEKRRQLFEKVHKMRNSSITYKQELSEIGPLFYIENVKNFLPK